MKITAVELFHISIPFAKPYKLSRLYGTRHDARTGLRVRNLETGEAQSARLTLFGG
mgnify:CR=1 FL=1